MCQPSWGRARAEAQRLSDLARLRRVRDRMDRECGRPLDIEALARAANLPAAPLGRQFRLAYGLAPHAYLMTRRVERATELLRRGDLSVTEVCSAVGGPSPATFRTCFAEQVGVSPDVYRQRATGEARPISDRSGMEKHPS
ncbi:helix-turn-helix domain-containing protein [Streptomyces formicae]|uniref:Transcriptional regulator, AraC family n=1 Tax=Streptomyces formicae TaxID=1616117 RepID=A0A291QN83_9ACTN|nr:helix-turn-helix transcriptional regulator [Streptomyces formicae]ATL32997.1 Transcriptional regulator, AraC family [Streptomyces formicae]